MPNPQRFYLSTVVLIAMLAVFGSSPHRSADVATPPINAPGASVALTTHNVTPQAVSDHLAAGRTVAESSTPPNVRDGTPGLAVTFVRCLKARVALRAAHDATSCQITPWRSRLDPSPRRLNSATKAASLPDVRGNRTPRAHLTVLKRAKPSSLNALAHDAVVTANTAPARSRSGNSLASYAVAVGAATPTGQVNLFSHSESLDDGSFWLVDQSKFIGNSAVAPDGTRSAEKLVAINPNTVHYFITFFLHNKPQQVRNNQEYTYSVHVKAGETPFGWIEYIRSSDMEPHFLGFDLRGGQFKFTDVDETIVTHGVQDAGNGWYRVFFTINSSTGSNGLIFAGGVRSPTNAHTWSGDGETGMYFWGAQLNFGRIKPYQPTTLGVRSLPGT